MIASIPWPQSALSFCRRQYNCIKSLMKNVCILLVLITYVYHSARFKKRSFVTALIILSIFWYCVLGLTDDDLFRSKHAVTKFLYVYMYVCMDICRYMHRVSFFPPRPISAGPVLRPTLCQRRFVRRVSGMCNSRWRELDKRSQWW